MSTLFEFELAPVEKITPWGTPDDPSLSWFALTDGWFRMPVGQQVLFQYTDEILMHWGVNERDANYQLAALARDILGSVAAGVASLPEKIEHLVSSWDILTMLRLNDSTEINDDLSYAAWRWLEERSPWTSYLVACPNFQFIRIGDQLYIHWDNRDELIDGISVWTAQQGVHVLPVSEFIEQCRGFMDHLLNAMNERIAAIETGGIVPQAPVSSASLWEQHATWQAEFASYFQGYEPDIAWKEAEQAIHLIAEKKGIPF